MNIRIFVAGAILWSVAAPCLAASVPILPEDGRFTMAVTIDGHEPLRFVVDTAAGSTFIASEVANQLQLPTKDDPQNGTTVSVATYSSPLFSRENDTLGTAPRTGMSVADGVVGMDLFVKQRVVFDFPEKTFSAEPSAPTPDGFVALPASLTSDTLAIVDVTIDGVKAKALIDSGARHTIANTLLRSALGFKNGDARLSVDHPVPGPKAPPAMKATVGSIEMGTVHIAKPVVSFSELPFFKGIGLSETPALLIVPTSCGISRSSRSTIRAQRYRSNRDRIRQRVREVEDDGVGRVFGVAVRVERTTILNC